ncbi:MAG: flagellar motor switch protein FliM [Firmicutes bacterium]|nr:flagellar motor switch protein FliM [Bacillota bacterium]
MEDILSQEEIDLLIKTANKIVKPDFEDPVEAVSVKGERYDFKRPSKFSKEQIRALERIHEQFCSTYGGIMSAKLRSRHDLKVESIEQLTFGEFTRSLPNPTVLIVLSAEPLEGNVVVQFTPSIASLLHDRLCGGPGRLEGPERTLTEIEMAVLRRQVVTVFCQMLKDSWQEVADIHFDYEYLETNPQFLQSAADRDIVILISLSFELNEVQDMISICIPYRTLEPIMKQLTQHRFFDQLRQPDPSKIKLLEEKVRAAQVPVEVELGTAELTVADLLELEPGDVIPLNKLKDDLLDVKVGSLTKFRGTPGSLGGRLGIKIEQVLDTEGVSDE